MYFLLAAGLHTVTLGACSEAEDIFEDSLAAFEPVILKGRSPSLRAAAVEALAIMCFVAAEGPEETVRVMEIFTKAFSNGAFMYVFIISKTHFLW